MQGDFTRQTFDRRKHFSKLLFQQGRVQLDAELNEQQEIASDLARVGARDAIGWAGVPKYGGGFKIAVTDSGEDLTISPGRIYVDGVLCVAETAPVTVKSLDKKSVTVGEWPELTFEKGDWFELGTEGGPSWIRRATKLDASKKVVEFEPALDPAKVADPTKLKLTLLPSYLRQPDLLDIPKIGDGTYLVYLDVWERLITAVDDPRIRERGLGGPDTAARAKVLWQVKLEATTEGASCSQFGPAWIPKAAQADGTLNVRTAPVKTKKDPCLVPAQAGYLGLENQLYRVEIHQGGKIGQGDVTFKWSRDNGSILTGLDDISGSTLTVSGLGPDDVHGFSDKQWVEIIDDAAELSQKSGPLVQIKTADRATDTIVLESTSATLPTSIDKARHYKLRRWDSDGPVKAEIPATNNGWIALENGLEIKFTAGGTYRAGDYWLVPARTAVASETGSLEWPLGADGSTLPQPPHGIHHHYAPLALVTVQQGQFKAPPLSDCRKPFPPLIEVGEGRSPAKGAPCCTFVVGDGATTHGDFDDIDEALRHLPQAGGELCLLPGDHRVNAVIQQRRNLTIRGCGLRTKVSPAARPKDPVFTVLDSYQILFSDLCVASFEGVAIALDAGAGQLREVQIRNGWLLGYRTAVHVQDGVHVDIRDNHVRVVDRPGGGVAIYMAATDSVIERNDIALSRSDEDSPDVDIPGTRQPFNPQDECAEFETLYRNRASHTDLVNRIFTRGRVLEIAAVALAMFTARARGGIQIAAGSERIRIRDNRIQGGSGNGILLGGWSRLQPARRDGPDESGRQENSIAHAGGLFYAVARAGDAAVPGATIRVTSQDTRAVSTAVTDRDGAFSIPNLAAGQYSLSPVSPGIRVADVRQDRRRREYVVVVEKADASEDPDVSKALAFLRDILIEDNRIFLMGRSGIGTTDVTSGESKSATRQAALQPRNPAVDLVRLHGNPILNLTIARNHIAACLNSGLTDELRVETTARGLGGISLGLCEDLSIIENRIENNGLAPLPVSAIFVGYGEHVEIALNRIQQNGAVGLDFKGDMLPGIRGGIFILLGASLFDPEAAEKKQYSAALHNYAVRIHGNTVSQPVGRALAVGALGPVAVQDNYFDSLSGPPGFLDELGGAVCVVNFGRPAARLIGPAGSVLFSDNQSQVGASHASSLPHLVFSFDDVQFEGNQLRTSQDGQRAPGVLNALVWSATARVGANRFQEPAAGSAASLVSWARLMNTTTGNQGDHCIFAFCADAGRLIPANNLTMAANCDAAGRVVNASVSQLVERRDV